MDRPEDAIAHGGTAGRLDSDQPGAGVDEAGERAGRVRTAPDAGDDDVRVEAAETVEALDPRLVAHDALQLADDVRIRMGTHD